MPIKIGTSGIAAAYVGADPISRIYVGADMVFGTPEVTLASLLFDDSQIGGLYQPWLEDSFYQNTSLTTLADTPGQIVEGIRDYSGNNWHLTGAGALGHTVPRGHINLLLATDTLATQDVTVTAAQHTLSFIGTGTVTLTGVSTDGPLVGTGAEDRVSLTFTPTAGTLTLTVSGTVELAQLNLGASFATPYQRVGATALDVSEAGSPTIRYVRTDGTSATGFIHTLGAALALPFTVAGDFDIVDPARLSMFGVGSASSNLIYAHITRNRAATADIEHRNGAQRGGAARFSTTTAPRAVVSCVFASATGRTVYARGGSVSDSTEVASDNFARVNLGSRFDSYSAVDFFGGYIRSGALDVSVVEEAATLLHDQVEMGVSF